MSKKINELIVKSIEKTFTENQNFVFAQYSGIKANDVASLRMELGEKNIKMFVIKNSLAKIAMERLNFGEALSFLDGQTAMFYGTDDQAVLAKLLVDAQKKEMITILGGVYDGDPVELTELKVYAALPSKEDMIAITVGTIAAPLTGTVSCMAGIIRKTVYALKGISDKKKES